MKIASASRPYIESHTALRGIAATLVVLDHLRAFQLVPLNGSWGRVLNALAWDDIAVYLFFILSGYVMAHVYASPVRWRSFLIARLARLIPVYEITLLVFAVLAATVGADREVLNFPNITANILMVQEWLPLPDWDSINLPAWSLSVEAFLYVAIFPGLVALRQLPFARFCFAALIFIGALWGVCFYNEFRGMLFVVWPLKMLCGICGFAAGFAAQELLALESPRHPTLLAITALVLIFTGVLNRVLFVDASGHLLLALGFLGLVVASADPASLAYRALAQRPLLYLGDISYSLYLWHFPLMMILVRLGSHLDNHLRSAAGHQAYACVLVGAVIIGSFLVATASYRWIEVPCRRLIRDRFVRATPGLHIAPSA